MNAMTPGRPKVPRGKAATAPEPQAGVRLTMDFDDDVPLDQLPDGGMDPAAFSATNPDATGSSGFAPGQETMEGQGGDEPDSGMPHRAGSGADSAADSGPAAERAAREGRPGADGRRPDVRSDGVADYEDRDDALPTGAADGSRPGGWGAAAPDPAPAVRARQTAATGRGDRMNAPGPYAPEQDWEDAEDAAETDPRSRAHDGWSHAPAPAGGQRPMGGPGPASPHTRPAEQQARRPVVPRRLSAITVTLSVELGRQQVALGDLMASAPGQFFTLDRLTSEPVEILVNGQPFARGDVVVLGDQFGVRLTELIDPER